MDDNGNQFSEFTIDRVTMRDNVKVYVCTVKGQSADESFGLCHVGPLTVIPSQFGRGVSASPTPYGVPSNSSSSAAATPVPSDSAGKTQIQGLVANSVLNCAVFLILCL